MTNTPAYQIAISLQISGFSFPGTEDFGQGLGDGWFFCYNKLLSYLFLFNRQALFGYRYLPFSHYVSNFSLLFSYAFFITGYALCC